MRHIEFNGCVYNELVYVAFENAVLFHRDMAISEIAQRLKTEFIPECESEIDRVCKLFSRVVICES